jgi:cytochrome c5
VKQLSFLMCLWVGVAACIGCSRTETPEPAQVRFELGPRVMQMWSANCALCHVDGNAGAPRIGIAQEWQSRLAKGPAVLLQHTIEGFNDMPPLGYCMACERSDFEDMISFMTAGIAETGIAEAGTVENKQ